MPLFLRPARAEDLPSVFEIRVRALLDDIWTRIIFPKGRSDKTIQKGMKAWEEDLTNPETALIVAVDEDSKAIVAFSKWIFVERAENEAELRHPYQVSSAGEEANDEVWRIFDEAKHGMHQRFKGEPHMYLSLLCTDPEQQGKGAGSALLKWGVDRADDKRLPCFLASTAAGHSLYLRRGFVDIEKLELDASRFGVQETARLDWMRRLPQRRP